MSAPVSHHPLVVNTADGSCWKRRAVTPVGSGLYALAGSVAGVPDEVLTSLAELAELGITGSAFALPMPVGVEPQVDADRAKAPWGRGEDGRPLLGQGAHWTDVPEVVDQELARIQGRVDQAKSGHWYVASDTEPWRPAGTVRTNVDGYQRTVGQVTNMLPADLELVLHAHDDLSWCLEMIAKLRTRVSELETQREADHKTWQHDLRTARDEREATAVRIAGLESKPDAITQLIAPMQALREDPHDSPLAHTYRVGRDLPEMGGAQ
ncbi:hypothetical protein [Streptomyces sp. AK02-04a]|uniref:hypothetical protein n=1 Tax=Streptomyces sp. AK02-04a TaxID=3028649 RepID=UPI0029A8DBE9|nr:hypothetical protein [Streptomyces sp. AK02-04a]MDX3759282.1 hypothetical protein [Streptomyces sp. AK02-04a]